MLQNIFCYHINILKKSVISEILRGKELTLNVDRYIYLLTQASNKTSVKITGLLAGI
jgi:hypothetical protein